MKSNCDKIKDQIADHITGILPETEIDTVRQHLSECSSCREHGQILEKEEQLLNGFFTEFDTDIARGEDEAISVINRLDTSSRSNIISVGNAITRNLLMKHAAAAVLIVFVTLYFIITLSWISQINECIRLSL